MNLIRHIRLISGCLFLFALAAPAAIIDGKVVSLDNPVLERAAERAESDTQTLELPHSRTLELLTTNRMARPVRVESTTLLAGKIVTRMTDGSILIAEPKRATTARVTPSGRDLLDAEVRALAVALDAPPDDPRALANRLAEHREKLNELDQAARSAASSAGAGAVGVLTGLVIGLGVAAKKKKADDIKEEPTKKETR